MTFLSPIQPFVPWLRALAIYYNDKEIDKRADELTELLGKVAVTDEMVELAWKRAFELDADCKSRMRYALEAVLGVTK